MTDLWIDVPSPFGLPKPSAAWMQPIADYDPDLRIYPSQKSPVYRLARVARHTGPMNGRVFGKLPGLHPDTRICLQYGLVAVTTIPRAAVTAAPPENIVKQLRARDTWRVDDGDVDKIVERLEQEDTDRDNAIDAANQEGLRARARAMRIGYLHRTGARVSLVRPLRPIPKDAGAPTTSTPGGNSPATVST